MKPLKMNGKIAVLSTLFAMSLIAEAVPAKITFAGGEGTSAEKAVIIKGATEQTGVHAEYEWLAKHYPGYKLSSQGLQNAGGHSYDVLHFTSSDGKSHDIYFDISDFFGK